MRPRIGHLVIRLVWAVTSILFVLHIGILTQPQLRDEDWTMVAAKMALLSLPIAVVYACIGLLLTVLAQEYAIGAMSQRVRRLVFWVPRLAGMLLALFVGVFALDVFNAGDGVWQTIAALVVHLIPTLLILAAVAIAWRWEWFGALAFAAFAGWMVMMFAEQWATDWTLYTVFIGPPLLVAALFAVNWRYHGELHPRQPATPTAG